MLAKELVADRLAASRTSRRALAGALHVAVGSPTPTGTIGLVEFAAARIDRLFDSRASLPPLWSRSRLALSVLAASLLAAVAAVPGRIDAGRGLEGLEAMLLREVPHGFPGLCLGFVLNGLLLVAIAVAARQLLSRRRRACTAT
jgi:hypothetical protein